MRVVLPSHIIFVRFLSLPASEENCIVCSTKDTCELLAKQFKAALLVFPKSEIR